MNMTLDFLKIPYYSQILYFAGFVYKLLRNVRLLNHVNHMTTVSAYAPCLFDCMNTLGCLSVNVWPNESAEFWCELNNATIATVMRNEMTYTVANMYYELDVTHCN